MKISRVRIKNLRSFADATIEFDDYTCLVGPNGAGKSTVLCALNIFFREVQNSTTNLLELDAQDFHHRNTAEPIEITVVFSALSQEAQEDFRDYYRQGELIVSAIATFDEQSGQAVVHQYGERLAMLTFAPFFQAANDGKKVAELKGLYQQIQSNISELAPPGTKDAMIEVLREYESKHPELCSPIRSEDQFYGLSKGANRLAKYVQWIYVPAVKDASSEQSEERNSALGKLLLRTVRSKIDFSDDINALRNKLREEYKQLMNNHQGVLESISTSLQTKLSRWAHPDASLKIVWSEGSDKSIKIDEPLARIIAGEGAFEGDLSRFGHGLQRSYLLALLQELSEADDSTSPRLILGCEEPELYQHPPQARHLAHVLRELSEGNAQVIISTHSPLFVSGESFQTIRLVSKERGSGVSMIASASATVVGSKIAAARGKKAVNLDGALAKINQALQPAINEMFFTPRLVLVEGIEDEAYITTYLHILGLWERFRQTGCHIVPASGKGHILQPLVIARELGIPTFVVFDSDADRPDNGHGSRAKHEEDNKAILLQFGVPEKAMPTETCWLDNVIVWSSELTTIVSSEIHSWDKVKSAAESHFGHAGDLQKNSLFIAHCLYESAKVDEISPSLKKLCDVLITFAESDQRHSVNG